MLIPPILLNMKQGQRLDVRALRDIPKSNGRRGTIKAGRVCQLYRYFDTYILGLDHYGNFTTYIDDPEIGVDYELILGRIPFPS